MKYTSLAFALLLSAHSLLPMEGDTELGDVAKPVTEKTPLNNPSARGFSSRDTKGKFCITMLVACAYAAGLSTVPFLKTVEKEMRHPSDKGSDFSVCPNGYEHFADADDLKCIRLHPTVEIQTADSQEDGVMGTLQLKYFTGAYPVDCSEIATKDKAMGPWGFSLQNLTYEVERAEAEMEDPVMAFSGRLWCYWEKNPGTVMVKVGANRFEQVAIPSDWKNPMIVMCTDSQVDDLKYYFGRDGIPFIKLNATDADTHMYIAGGTPGSDLIFAQWSHIPTRYSPFSWVNIKKGLSHGAVSFDTLDVIGTNNISHTVSLKEQARAAQFEKKKQQFTQPKLHNRSVSRRGR